MSRSIRWRIAIPYVILILAIMLALSAYLSAQVRLAHLADLQGQMLAESRLLAAEAGPWLAQAEGDGVLDSQARRWADLLGARVTIISRTGAVLGESHAERGNMENHLDRPEVQQALLTGQGSSVRPSETVGHDMIYVATAIRAEGQVAGVVRLAVSLEAVEARIARLRQTILAVTLPATLVAVLIALLIAERTGRPIRKLTEVAERLAKGDLDARLVPTTRDEVGQLTQVFNHMADRLQEQVAGLAREQSRLAGILEHMADGVIIADGDGQVLLINPAAAQLLQTSARDAVGRSLAQVLRHHQLIQLWRRSRERHEEQAATVEVDLQGLFVQAIVTPLPEPSRQGFLVILQDLTRIRRLETVRRDFVSNISHELRTPLASLKALAETLRDGALEDPPAAKRFLDRMETEVDSLAQMVQELLELSRIESGRAPLRLEPVAVAEVVMPPVERLRPQAERAGLTLAVHVGAGLPPIVADAERLRLVITNLVHNAIKFTPPQGQVTVTASAAGNEVTISVRDTGVGIASEDLPRIFERFFKADRARSGGGTGLGLAIAKHIVQAHGGRIWVESRRGEGSTFFVSLPLPVASSSL